MSAKPDPFDRLHDALVASAAGAPSEGVSARRCRPGRRVGLLGLAAVLIGGTAVAATTPWHPQILTDGGGPDAPPSLSRTPIPAEQRAALGVLRREQDDRDRSTPTENGLRAIGVPGRGVRLDSIRLLRSSDGSATFLASVARLGDRRYAPVVRDALCVSQTTTLTKRRAASRSSIDTPGGPIPAPVSAGGSNCGSFADLLKGRLRTVTTGVVPDGVAAARVKLTTGRVLTAPVRDNFYVFPIDLGGTVDSDSPAGRAVFRRFRTINGRRIDWLDARGEVVRKNDVARSLREARGG